MDNGLRAAQVSVRISELCAFALLGRLRNIAATICSEQVKSDSLVLSLRQHHLHLPTTFRPEHLGLPHSPRHEAETLSCPITNLHLLVSQRQMIHGIGTMR